MNGSNNITWRVANISKFCIACLPETRLTFNGNPNAQPRAIGSGLLGQFVCTKSDCRGWPQVIAVSDYFGLNSLYYSVSIRKCNNESGSYDPAYEDLVKQRILALHANGIATRLYLLQDVGFLDGTYGPTAWVEHIDAANNFLQRNRDVAEAVRIPCMKEAG